MGRLDCAGLCVWAGQAVWVRPAQKELAGQTVQFWLRTVRFPTNPALQRQSPRRLLPVVAVLELAGQVVQPVPPCSVMYVPVAQAAHVKLLGAPEAVEKVPGEQDVQFPAVAAPRTVEYLPPEQTAHAKTLVRPVPVW